MRHLTLVFLTATLLSGCLGCDQTEDYSGFNRVAFEQGAGLGFCPDTETVYTAVIAQSGPDAFTFNATVLQAQPGEDVETCSTGLQAESGCLEAVALPPRSLSSEELAQVRTVFANVTVEPSPDPMCKVMGIDPCRILSFQWDDNEHNDFVCSANRLESEQAVAIVDLLSALRDGG